MTSYDNAFFDYVNSGSLTSARAMLPLLRAQLTINSVLDIGCGQGGWLSVWKEMGCVTVHGVDGDYVERDRLLIEPAEFTAADLSEPFELESRFDLVQSLEVAEHLPTASSADFVASIVKHAPVVLFSAAPPGQGGDNHVNEQNYEFWREHFATHGYVAIDYIRPLILENREIEVWYRYNPFLYVSKEHVDRLPEAVKTCIVPAHEALIDRSPRLYKIRKAIIRLLPGAVATKLAKLKEAIIFRRRTAA